VTLPMNGSLTRRALGIGALAGGAAAVGLLGGCGSDKRKVSGSAPDKVTYLTSFGLNGREGYAHVANAKGFFAGAGLDVQIRAGAAADSNNSLIASGKAQFAAVDSSGAFIRYANKSGKGVDKGFQVVAGIHQRTLMSLISLDLWGITSPRGLEGRKVAGVAGSAIEKMWPAYARLAGVDAQKVHWQHAEATELPGLLATGQVVAVALFALAAGGVEKVAQGSRAVVLGYDEYLGDLFGNVLICSETLAAGNPDLVRRFTGALLNGLVYAVSNPGESARILKQAVPTTDVAVAAGELERMRNYILPPAGHPVGYLDMAAAARMVASLQSNGLIDSFEPETLIRHEFLDDAPTLAGGARPVPSGSAR